MQNVTVMYTFYNFSYNHTKWYFGISEWKLFESTGLADARVKATQLHKYNLYE